ncbi:hypothetical protein Golob_008152 [Gossypium lobatum]|uniref:Uncharacterized protein n=1 Tax=Gossypium lobatum TaxID=34289 RepID=A0A7J8MEV1_9ROSI|nr:hypothetical protein [Gossypium lobatum]
MGGYLAMKENIVVCTSLANSVDSFYTISGWLAHLVIEVVSCSSRVVEVVGTRKGKEVEPKCETSQLQKENMKIQKDVKGKIVQMLCK